MGKRSHSDFAGGRQAPSASPSSRTSGGNSEAKRQRSDADADADVDVNVDAQAIESIRKRADDLIASLQALKEGNSSSISSLSRELLPAFQTVAASSDPRPRPHPAPPIRRGLELVDPILIMPWTAEDILPDLPPLPPADPELTQAVFTHPASDAAQKGAMSYDRLEWIGDANLYTMASYLIFSTFGGLNPGRCSQLRERLIRNQTLAAFFIEYGLDKRARLPDQAFANGRMEKVWGDMFEAYVAAVLHSDAHRGLGRVFRWLRVLWARTLKMEIKQIEEKPEMGRVREMGEEKPVSETASAKLRISQLIRVPGIELIYEDAPNKQKNKLHNLQMFSVRLYLKGWGEEKKLLGWGTAHSKKEAGQKAAMMALENKKVMAVYEKKKRAYVEEKAGRAAAEPEQKQ